MDATRILIYVLIAVAGIAVGAAVVRLVWHAAGLYLIRRAASCIGEDCRFTEARFELDDPHVRKMFEEHSWAWNDNPFVGTKPLHGLKVLTMLLSNWDTKDRRDVARGSNTAIFEHRVSRWRREARYLITDWGGSRIGSCTTRSWRAAPGKTTRGGSRGRFASASRSCRVRSVAPPEHQRQRRGRRVS